MNLRNRRFAEDPSPIDPTCGCGVCARWSRAYLRHLLSVSEPTAPRLLTLHNVAWTFALVERVRAAVAAGRLGDLRAEVTAVWGPGPPGTPGDGDHDRGLH
jgi:queuine tRNA-ribosyltransferase